ncbi:MAG: carbon monoxide dehydrogenase subunit G [Alphaproteobacteria bacterium]|nr:carbon monoxide dehydrogenase subunit G [Alphaproteobacteria bacterium]
MDFDGEYRIPAPPGQVWLALNDPAVLAGCIPGCKTLERRDDGRFSATIEAKVGPVRAIFAGSVEMADLDPPFAYTLRGQGQAGPAGFARGEARVTLSADGEGTLLRYTARAEIGGKLATVGSRLIQGVARKTADDFFEAFARGRVPAVPVEAPPAPPARFPWLGPALFLPVLWLIFLS